MRKLRDVCNGSLRCCSGTLTPDLQHQDRRRPCPRSGPRAVARWQTGRSQSLGSQRREPAISGSSTWRAVFRCGLRFDAADELAPRWLAQRAAMLHSLEILVPTYSTTATGAEILHLKRPDAGSRTNGHHRHQLSRGGAGDPKRHFARTARGTSTKLRGSSRDVTSERTEP